MLVSIAYNRIILNFNIIETFVYFTLLFTYIFPILKNVIIIYNFIKLINIRVVNFVQIIMEVFKLNISLFKVPNLFKKLFLIVISQSLEV